MSLIYINPATKKPEIKNRLLQTLTLFEGAVNDPELFFLVLNRLGCFINVFFRNQVFSSTDCCTTVESLWSLFSPQRRANIVINTTSDLKILFSDPNYNIYNFRALSHTFHTFIILNYNGAWYLLQSYVNVCEMNTVKDNNLPTKLMLLLETRSVPVYNSLFGTSFPSDTTKIAKLYYDVDAGYYEFLPTDKLKGLIKSYVG